MTTIYATLTDSQFVILRDAAAKVGTSYGRNAAGWVDVTSDNASYWLDKMADCDMDIDAPLSGEWADGLTEVQVVQESIDTADLWRWVDPSDIDPDAVSIVVDFFESAYYAGFEAKLTEMCEYHIG